MFCLLYSKYSFVVTWTHTIVYCCCLCFYGCCSYCCLYYCHSWHYRSMLNPMSMFPFQWIFLYTSPNDLFHTQMYCSFVCLSICRLVGLRVYTSCSGKFVNMPFVSVVCGIMSLSAPCLTWIYINKTFEWASKTIFIYAILFLLTAIIFSIFFFFGKFIIWISQFINIILVLV